MNDVTRSHPAHIVVITVSKQSQWFPPFNPTYDGLIVDIGLTATKTHPCTEVGLVGKESSGAAESCRQ